MTWRVGIEFEWLAPKGLSRQSYAQYFATQHRQNSALWHPQVEPSKVPGKPIFTTSHKAFLFKVGLERFLCTPLAISPSNNNAKTHPPAPNWFQSVSDDMRLLQLISRHARTIGTPTDILTPIADLFGTTPTTHENIVRVEDIQGAAVALCAPMPGERKESVKWSVDRENPSEHTINRLIEPAQNLHFTIPSNLRHISIFVREACNPRTLRNLICLLHTSLCASKTP